MVIGRKKVYELSLRVWNIKHLFNVTIATKLAAYTISVKCCQPQLHQPSVGGTPFSTFIVWLLEAAVVQVFSQDGKTLMFFLGMLPATYLIGRIMEMRQGGIVMLRQLKDSSCPNSIFITTETYKVAATSIFFCLISGICLHAEMTIKHFEPIKWKFWVQ